MLSALWVGKEFHDEAGQVGAGNVADLTGQVRHAGRKDGVVAEFPQAGRGERGRSVDIASAEGVADHRVIAGVLEGPQAVPEQS